MALWKFVAENYTAKFDTLKLTLKNNIKELKKKWKFNWNHTFAIQECKKLLTYHIFIQIKILFWIIHNVHQISYNHTDNLNSIIIRLGSLLL